MPWSGDGDFGGGGLVRNGKILTSQYMTGWRAEA